MWDGYFTFSFYITSPKNVVLNPDITTTLVSIILPLEDKKTNPPKFLIKQNINRANQEKFVQNILFVPKTDSADQLNDISELKIGSTTILNLQEGPVDDESLMLSGKNEVGQKSITPETYFSKQMPYDNPDIQASFPGGENALIRFLENNLQVPANLEAQETRQVKVKFVVDFNGDLQSFTVIEDGGELYNTEVVRVLKKMPKWNPGKKGGQNVPVFYTIPVKFTADE